MTLLCRQRLTAIPLVVYWIGIFILTHLPVLPRVLLRGVSLSDVSLHYIAYLILVFLIWLAITPDKKVNWRKAATWWVLFVVVWYGVVDEWLQGYVGRCPDVKDFLADLAGALTGLVLLSIFPFWPVSLVLTGATLFILTNFMQVGPTDQLFVVSMVFHLLGYAVFSLLWIKYLHYLLPIRPPQSRWLLGVLAPPVFFLLAAEIFSGLVCERIRFQNVTISLVGITVVVAAVFLIALLRQRFTKSASPGDA